VTPDRLGRIPESPTLRRALLAALVLALPGGFAGDVRADDLALRAPDRELEIELPASAPAARLAIEWICYASDLAQATRETVEALRAAGACTPDPVTLRTEIEGRAGGRVLGGGEARTLDPAPGSAAVVSADYCYTPEDVGFVVRFAGSQLERACRPPERSLVLETEEPAIPDPPSEDVAPGDP